MKTASLKSSNVLLLQEEMQWLQRIIQFRLALHERRDFSETHPITREWIKRSSPDEIQAPELVDGIALHDHLRMHPGYEFADRVLIAMGIAIHISPQTFQGLHFQRAKDMAGLPQAGGISTSQYAGFIPTAVTWLWLGVQGKPVNMRAS